MLFNKFKNLLIAAAILTMCSLFVFVLYSYSNTTLNWKYFFKQGYEVGTNCEYAIDKWQANDNFDQIIKRQHQFTKLPMPYRSAPSSIKPKVSDQQYLYTKCYINTTEIEFSNYALLYLGRALGEVAVFIDDDWVSYQSDNGRLQLNLPPELWDTNFVLTIIARPTFQYPNPGLATLTPLVLINDRLVIESIYRGMDFWRVEGPAIRLSFGLALTIIFIVAWILGIRYRDLEWMILLVTIWCLHAFVEYTPAGQPLKSQDLMSQNLIFLQILALGGFIFSFTRINLKHFKFEYIFLIFGSIYTLLTYTTDLRWQDNIGFKSHFPFFFASLQFLVLSFICYYHSKKLNNTHARRLFVYMLATSFASILFLIQAYLNLTHAIDFSDLILMFFLTVFSSFLGADLVVFHRQYLNEKSLRIIEEQEKNQLAERLLLGRSVQDKLLPKARIGQFNNFEYKLYYMPSQTMSGDWLHVWEEENRKVLFIGDVMGKGPQAAIVMSTIISSLNTSRKLKHPVIESIKYLNQQLIDLFNYKTTSSLAAIELRTDNSVILYNCGSLGWLYKTPKTDLKILCEANNQLGITKDVNIKQEQIKVEHDSYIFSFTDGVLEGSRALKKLFEEINKDPNLDLDSFYDHTLKINNENPVDDDKTMIIIKNS